MQMAALLILEPIFEADFEDCSYGFRPGRSAHQALEEIRGHLKAGYQAVYDADLKGYFDSIPHPRLMACLRMRVADRQVLKLIRLWLETPVVEPPETKGGAPKVSRAEKGTPLCRRLRRVGVSSKPEAGWVPGVEAGSLDGIGDQSGEDTGIALGAEGSELGLSGIYVPV